MEKGIVLYGASCVMKTTLAKQLNEKIEGSAILTYSNSHIVDFYKDAGYAPSCLDVLVSRASYYEGNGAYSVEKPIFDRFLLDEYVWGIINNDPTVSNNISFPIDAIYDWETDLSARVLKRFLIINQDYDFIRKHATDRLVYLGVNNIDDFIQKCEQFNEMFMLLTRNDIIPITITDVTRSVIETDLTRNEILHNFYKE